MKTFRTWVQLREQQFADKDEQGDYDNNVQLAQQASQKFHCNTYIYTHRIENYNVNSFGHITTSAAAFKNPQKLQEIWKNIIATVTPDGKVTKGQPDIDAFMQDVQSHKQNRDAIIAKNRAARPPAPVQSGRGLPAEWRPTVPPTVGGGSGIRR